MNHTPRPWKIARYNKGRKLYVNSSDAQIAHVLHTETRGLINTTEKREANARLIAAAPDLLAELRNILRCFDRDNVPAHHFDKPRGTGVNVGITYQQAARIRELIKATK